MVRLERFDIKAKELLDTKHDKYYKEIKGNYKQVIKFIDSLKLKNSVGVGLTYELFRNRLDLEIGVEDIDKDVTAKQMYMLTEYFKQEFEDRLGYVIRLSEFRDIGDYYDGEEYGEEYEIYNILEYKNSKEGMFKEYESYVKSELGKDYNFAVRTTIGDGVRRETFDYKYGYGREELTDKERVMSRYLSTKLSFVSNEFTKGVSDKVKGVKTKDSLTGIPEDISYVRTVFETPKVKEGIKGTGMLKDLRYGVKFKRGRVSLDIIVEGYDLNMNYLNGRNYLNYLNKEDIKHIDVNIVVRNICIPDTLTGSYNSRVNRQDEVVRQALTSSESLDLTESVSEMVKHTLGFKKTDVNKGFGNVLVDITKHYDLTLIEDYGWVSEFMAFNDGDLVLHVGHTDGSYSLNEVEKEELKLKLTDKNAEKLYNYLIKELVKKG